MEANDNIVEPIFISIDDNNAFYVTYHSGDDVERGLATKKLLTTKDFNTDGSLIRKDISYTEMKCKEMESDMKKHFREAFPNSTEDSIFIMRFFEKVNDEFKPVFLHDLISEYTKGDLENES